MQNKEYQKNYSMLRPFDLEAAKSGELLFCTHDFTDREYIAGPDNSGRIIVKDNYGEFQFSQYYTDHYRMKPLAWVEGKPVYKGDVLYGKKYSKYKYTVSHVYGDSIFTIPNETGSYSETADNLTWNKPKQKVKRKVWINVYPEDLDSIAHPSKQQADQTAADYRIACVETEIEYEV